MMPFHERDRYFSHTEVTVDVPDGVFFYPCCGDDIAFPLRLFWKHVETFHFADIAPIRLPAIPLETKHLSPRGEVMRVQQPRPGDLAEVAELRESLNMSAFYDALIDASYTPPIRPRISRMHVPEIGLISVEIRPHKTTWFFKDERAITLYKYHSDAYAAFQQIDPIAVFFLSR